jgi:hypothetical protein
MYNNGKRKQGENGKGCQNQKNIEEASRINISYLTHYTSN